MNIPRAGALLMHFDFSDPDCYPGQGTTVTNLANDDTGNLLPEGSSDADKRPTWHIEHNYEGKSRVPRLHTLALSDREFVVVGTAIDYTESKPVELARFYQFGDVTDPFEADKAKPKEPQKIEAVPVQPRYVYDGFGQFASVWTDRNGGHQYVALNDPAPQAGKIVIYARKST